MAHVNGGDVAAVSARVPLNVRREVERAERDAYFRANRMRSLQFVTQAGMATAANLTSYEAMLADQVPIAAGRLAAINDVAIAAIAAEIRAVVR